MASKFDGRYKNLLLRKALGIEDWPGFIKEHYDAGMSGIEISELIKERTGIEISARSIQRMLVKHGRVLRTVKEAFQNAMQRGRVTWQLEEQAKKDAGRPKQLSPKKRYEILRRDGFKCRACGAKEMLQVDHILAKIHGGGDEDSNLQTLCLECNQGKRGVEKEHALGGGLKGGRGDS